MIKDKFMAGVLIGILADAVKLLVNYLAYLLNFTKVVFRQIVAAYFFNAKDLNSPLAYLIGGIADLVVTIILGIIFVYLVSYTTSRYLWVKGLGFGLATRVTFGTFLGSVVQTKLPQNPVGVMVTLVAHLFFGLALALFTNVFLDKEGLAS